jgi:cbb3-type cytochrome oxidase maturation protein
VSLLLLLALSVGMGLAGLAAFMWALGNGQFDDPDGNAWRVIAPQDPPVTKGPSGTKEGSRRRGAA